MEDSQTWPQDTFLSLYVCTTLNWCTQGSTQKIMPVDSGRTVGTRPENYVDRWKVLLPLPQSVKKTLFGPSCGMLRHILLGGGCKIAFHYIAHVNCFLNEKAHCSRIFQWKVSRLGHQPKAANPWPTHRPDLNPLDFQFLTAKSGFQVKTELDRLSSASCP